LFLALATLLASAIASAALSFLRRHGLAVLTLVAFFPRRLTLTLLTTLLVRASLANLFFSIPLIFAVVRCH